MLRDRQRVLRYVILPDLDHGYIDADGMDRSGEVLTAFLDWALAPEKDRSVVVGLEPAAPRKRELPSGIRCCDVEARAAAVLKTLRAPVS
jgi:hypothetical protein